ncbi:MAG TPA: hypothetical protein VGS62_01560 [Streptosporangiaceae bacterium]|nr:hypothetical protein [Streptosporangiaceae bacterium]
MAGDERFLLHRGLIAFCAAGAMVEAGILTVIAPAARPLAPQVTALPPFAVFHDLRWLFGYNRSWLEFAGGAVILILARSAVSTTLVRLAWPAYLPAPRLLATFRASLVFTLLAAVIMVPVATLVFGVALLPFSWPFLAAVPVMLAIVLPLSHGGVIPAWWRKVPPARVAWWALLCFLEYSLAGVVIARLPAAAVVPVAGLAGVINARAWYGLAMAVTRPARFRPHPLVAWIPIAPLAAVSVFALAVGTTRLIFDATTTRPRTGFAAISAASASAGLAAAASAAAARPARGLRGPAVLVIAGFGSSCCHKSHSLQQAAPGFNVQQFSYRGLDAAGRPIPHGPSASNLPLPVLGDRIAEQVERLHRQTGKLVDLVAESEGTLGVYAMFARHPDAPVSSVVLLSPIVAPGQVSFPAAGRQGPGMVSGYALRELNRFVGGLSPFGSSGAQQLIDSVSRVGARYAASVTRVRSVRWLGLVPLADALTLPACAMPPNVLFVPAFHGGLLGEPAVLRMVRDFLAGHRVTGPPGLREAAEILSSAAAPWRMPELSAPSPPCPA